MTASFILTLRDKISRAFKKLYHFPDVILSCDKVASSGIASKQCDAFPRPLPGFAGMGEKRFPGFGARRHAKNAKSSCSQGAGEGKYIANSTYKDGTG
jgi:hypothetical protein